MNPPVLRPAQPRPAHALLVLLALWCFATAWNVGKAFHIDDAGHLEIARWIAANPWNPMSGPLNWGRDVEPIHHTNQPHLYFYLMAAWGWLFGWSEIAMHALMAIFTGWAILAFHRLAAWLRPDAALAASALFALGPAFVVLQNTMVDVPLVAVWIAFHGALLNPESPARRRYGVAAGWCAIALLIKYSSLILLPALVLYALLERRPRQAAWVLLPLAVLGLWSLFNLLDYGSVHIAGRKGTPHSAADAEQMAANWMVMLGAMATFTPWALGAWLQRGQPLVVRGAIWAVLGLFALAPAVVLAGGLLAVSEEWTYRLMKLSFLSVSWGLVLALLLCGTRLATQRGLQLADGLLLYWLLATTMFMVGLAPFMAARHVLLALPPLLLLFMRWQPAGVPRAATVTAVVWTLALTSVLAAADRALADLYRRHAASIRASLPAEATVWFTGHWGWQWYAAQAGMRQFSAARDRPAVGDYVVRPAFTSPSDGPPAETLEAYRTITIERGNWLDTFVDNAVGLYASSSWKFQWGRFTGPLEVFHVDRVVAARDIQAAPAPTD